MAKQKRKPRRRRPRAARTPPAPARARGTAEAPPPPPLPATPAPAGLTRHGAAAALALALLVAAAYLPAMLWGGFVWDDSGITEAAPVREPAGLRSIWFTPAALRQWEGHYWPLVYTTFWLEHKLWGFAPAGYHVVNVLLHLANTLLTWRLLRRLAAPGAWIVAAVFAVHPVHVESVAWVIERKDVLSGLCYLAAFLAWLRFTEARRPAPRARRYLLVLALFGLGMLCKSIVVTLPAALLIAQWWKQGRSTGRDLLALAPLCALGLAIAVADLAFYRSNEVIAFDYTAVERALIAARALWFYAGKLLWPADLAVIYPLWEVSAADPAAWGYLIAAAALAGALWLLRHRIGRGPLAGALFFAVTLAPVLGFVDYGYQQFSLVADRHQYLAAGGVIAVLVGAAATGAQRCGVGLPALGTGRWRWAGGRTAGGRKAAPAGAAADPAARAAAWSAAAVVVAVLAVLAALTWRQAGIYRDEVTFYSHVVAHNPAAHDAAYNFGVALAAVERFAEAEEQFRQALALTPGHERAHRNLGVAQLRRQRYEEALATYRRFLERYPDSAVGHANLGIALHYLGRTDAALASLDRALALDPALQVARNNRALMPRIKAHADAGLGLMAAGRLDAAAPYLRAVVEADPRYVIAHRALARLELRRQRYAQALDLFQGLVDTYPDAAAAHAGRGEALFHLGRDAEALASLDRALALDPALAEAQAVRAALVGR